ncbi:MAG: hypothetical protein K6B28_03145 [Lachnospiraceae bacterium]|nr:hypothetical protein [Lachnospiraceae bacterium]
MKRVIICDTNTVYAKKLADYINNHSSGDKVILYTDTESFDLELSDMDSSSLIIISEDFAKGAGMSYGYADNEKIFLLSDDMQRVRENGAIYRYQPADYILRLTERSGRTDDGVIRDEGSDTYAGINRGIDPVINEKTGIITVYSPLGRVLKTTFSLTLAGLMSGYGKAHKVLYVNLEGYSGIGNIYDIKDKSTMAELIYDYSTDKESTLKNMENYVYDTGEIYILYPGPWSELEDIDAHTWIELFSSIIKAQIFDLIIIDAGSCIHGITELISNSDKVFMPVRRDVLSVFKLEEFKEDLRRISDDAVYEKVVREIELPWFNDLNVDHYDLCASELAEYIRNEGLLSLI